MCSINFYRNISFVEALRFKNVSNAGDWAREDKVRYITILSRVPLGGRAGVSCLPESDFVGL